MTSRPAILHTDSGQTWGGGQNQVRLLMRELAKEGVRQLCVCPEGSALAQRLAAEGLPVKAIKWRGVHDPRAFVAFWRALNGFDVVHCHDAHALQIAILPAKLRNRKIVAARRVPFASHPVKWNAADRIIAVSETVRASLLESRVDNDRIRVIHSGTDLNETRSVAPLQPALREQHAIPADAFVAGNAASFYAWKGQSLIPAAAALLPSVHWFIAGEGPERAAIEAAIAEHQVADRVHLLGWIADARAMIRELDVYVSTSTEDGLGNSITESLALRVPVIAAAAGGAAEIVRPVHERTGVALFDAGNARALADALELLRDEALRQKVVAAQDERFQAFAIERTAAATLAVYRELVQ